MATPLAETITLKTPAQLYDMRESGWNSSVAGVELARRSLPLKRPPTKKPTRTHYRFHAKRPVKVTGGRVDLPSYTRLTREHLPGERMDPWY